MIFVILTWAVFGAVGSAGGFTAVLPSLGFISHESVPAF